MCSSPWVKEISTIIASRVFRMTWPFLRRIEKIFDNKYPLCDDAEFRELFVGKKIAIVGNGPNIDGKWWEIDNHDFVIRMNFWVLPWFLDSKNTWNKTDLASFWAIQVIGSPKIAAYVKKIWISVLFCVSSPWSQERPSPVFCRMSIKMMYWWVEKKGILSYEFVKYLETLTGWSPPSTGFATLMFLLRFNEFQQLSIYGFQFSSNNRIVWNMWNVPHDFQIERKIILEAIKGKNNIHLIS